MNGKPVHYIPAKSVLNLDSGFAHKLLCSGPTFSLGSACAYSCTFCYVPDLMRKNPHWQAISKQYEQAEFADVVIRRQGGLEVLKNQLLGAKGKPRFMGDDQAGRVVYASPLVDVAANLELVEETVAACRMILDWTRWDIRLLSKSHLLPKVAQALGKTHPAEALKRIIYGVSTGTASSELARAFEVGTALVAKRLESLHWLQDNGHRTFGMLCPTLPLPGGDYEAEARRLYLAIRAPYCEHVWAEVINVRGDSMTRTVAALRQGGFADHASELERVSQDAAAWEAYARQTFIGHVLAGYRPGQLRFLQYVTKATRPWWADREEEGAVLL